MSANIQKNVTCGSGTYLGPETAKAILCLCPKVLLNMFVCLCLYLACTVTWRRYKVFKLYWWTQLRYCYLCHWLSVDRVSDITCFIICLLPSARMKTNIRLLYGLYLNILCIVCETSVKPKQSVCMGTTSSLPLGSDCEAFYALLFSDVMWFLFCTIRQRARNAIP